MTVPPFFQGPAEIPQHKSKKYLADRWVKMINNRWKACGRAAGAEAIPNQAGDTASYIIGSNLDEYGMARWYK